MKPNAMQTKITRCSLAFWFSVKMHLFLFIAHYVNQGPQNVESG